MHLVEMFKEQRLVGELQPLRKAEKGRADHHRVRAQREQGMPKEKTPVRRTGAPPNSPIQGVKEAQDCR